MATSIVVRLTVSAEALDHQALSTRLGVEATETWRKGDALGKSVLKRQDDGWVYARPASDSLELEDELLVLLKSFGSATLREIGVEYELEVGAVVLIEDGETPTINLSADTLRRLHELGAELDIDLQVV